MLSKVEEVLNPLIEELNEADTLLFFQWEYNQDNFFFKWILLLHILNS